MRKSLPEKECIPMKKMLCTLLSVLMLCICFAACADTVDAYTSASTTKTLLADEALAGAAAALSNASSDLATQAEAAAEGYQPKNSSFAQIMTTNPDGCPGVSTISYWSYVNNREDGADVSLNVDDWSFARRGEGSDQLVMELTYGQNALNLYNQGIGGRATLLVQIDNASYLVHLSVTDTYVKPFDEAELAAGNYPVGFGGVHNNAYYFVCDVLGVECSYALML